MPLLDITGATSTNQIFSAGFCFMMDSTKESFFWALVQLQDLFSAELIPDPVTIFTDKEQALLNALPQVFSAALILCLWHINKNILSRARKAIREYLEIQIKEAIKNGESLPLKNDDPVQERIHRWFIMKQLWIEVVVAWTLEDYKTKWQEFKQIYDHTLFVDLIEYIEKEWLGESKKSFLLLFYSGISSS